MTDTARIELGKKIAERYQDYLQRKSQEIKQADRLLNNMYVTWRLSDEQLRIHNTTFPNRYWQEEDRNRTVMKIPLGRKLISIRQNPKMFDTPHHLGHLTRELESLEYKILERKMIKEEYTYLRTTPEAEIIQAMVKKYERKIK